MKIRDIPIGGKFRYHGREFTVVGFTGGTSPTACLITVECDDGIFGIATHTFTGATECEPAQTPPEKP